MRTNGEVYPDQYAGARVVVNLANIELNGDDPRAVMRHELAHAIAARVTEVAFSVNGVRFGGSIWPIEGFARWVEDLDNPSRIAANRAQVAAGVSAGKFHGLPPSSDKFYGGDIGFNYALGASVFRYIEQIRGRQAAIDFDTALLQMGFTESQDLVKAPGFDRLCARVLGVSTSAAFFGRSRCAPSYQPSLTASMQKTTPSQARPATQPRMKKMPKIPVASTRENLTLRARSSVSAAGTASSHRVVMTASAAVP